MITWVNCSSGPNVKSHIFTIQVILSASSTFFRDLLSNDHPQPLLLRGLKVCLDWILYFHINELSTSGNRSDIGGGLHLPRGSGSWKGQLVRLSGNRGEAEAERPRKDTRALGLSGHYFFFSLCTCCVKLPSSPLKQSIAVHGYLFFKLIEGKCWPFQHCCMKTKCAEVQKVEGKVVKNHVITLRLLEHFCEIAKLYLQ